MKVEEIYERLKKVKEPLTEVDVVSLGLVEKVIADEDGVRVYILDDVASLEILDSRTLERYYPLEED